VYSAFSELHLPLVGENNRRPFFDALSASLAARFEHCQDIGSTLLTRDGFEWRVFRGVSLRASYSESFRPPGVLDLDESANVHVYSTLSDPDAAGENSNVLIWAGRNSELREERARSWTAGLDLSAPNGRGTAAITYFITRFFDRLTQPVYSTDLLSNRNFASLVIRNPSKEAREEVCERSLPTESAPDCLSVPIAAIVDLRYRNDAAVRMRGIDMVARYSLHTQFGEVTFGLIGTYILEFSEARSATEPLRNLVSTPHYPIDLRVRASVAWQRGAFSADAFLNFQDAYRDTNSYPNRRVSSWTTLDASVGYRARWGGWLGDMAVALSADNLFDSDPPFLNNGVGIGYDQENGHLMGRVVRMDVRWEW
jgi:outer membrane receptor protein involved in Fe transport